MEGILDNYKNRARKFILQHVKINDHDWQEFSKILEYKEFSKNSFLTKNGEVENYLYFLIEGAVRLFNKFENHEYTLRFNFPNSFFNAYASFISRSPSYLSIQTLTPVKVFRIRYENLENLYSISKNAEKVGRKMLEYFYLQREFKEIELHTKSAEENYLICLK